MIIFTSYYTKNYAQEIKKLDASLHLFNLQHHIVEINDLGDWRKNTCHKAQHCLMMLLEHNEPIVFVDADAIVQQRPGLLIDMPAGIDLACHFRKWRLNAHELLTGTLYLANNERIKHLVMEWGKENERNPAIWEQKNLQTVVERKPWKDTIKVYELPESYCQIFDSKTKTGQPVIEHFQASRRFRTR